MLHRLQWCSTNHPQHTDSILNHCGQPTGTEPGNPDQQPQGFDGEITKNTAHPSGFQLPAEHSARYRRRALCGCTIRRLFLPAARSSTTSMAAAAQLLHWAEQYRHPRLQRHTCTTRRPSTTTSPIRSINVVSPFDRTTDTLVDPPITYPPYDDYAQRSQRRMGVMSGRSTIPTGAAARRPTATIRRSLPAAAASISPRAMPAPLTLRAECPRSVLAILVRLCIPAYRPAPTGWPSRIPGWPQQPALIPPA